MPIILEDWETESGHYLNEGRKVKDFDSHKSYSISGFSEDKIKLKQIPYFSTVQGQDIEISFSELITAFKDGILAVEGFDFGQVKELKIAVANLEKKLKIEAKDQQLISKDSEISEAKAKAEAKEAELAQINEDKERKRLEKEALRVRQAKAKEFEIDIVGVELSI